MRAGNLIRWIPVVVLGAAVALSLSVRAAGYDAFGPRGSFDWRDYSYLPYHAWSGRIVIKIVEGTGPILKGNLIVSGEGGLILNVEKHLPAGSIKTLRQGFGMDTERLRALKEYGEARCGCELADLSTYFTLDLDGRSVDLPDALRELGTQPCVEIAYPVSNILLVPPPFDIPPPTPDFSAFQGYMGPAPDGVNVLYAAMLPGGRGGGIEIVDIEVDWDEMHEDIDTCLGGLVPNFEGLTRYREEWRYIHHGTAVLGILFGGDNDYGITGITPEATCLFAPDYTDEYGVDVPLAMLWSAEVMGEGGVFILEGQEFGPNYDPETNAGLVPLEWAPAVYDTIRNLAASGMIIVEPAANGWENLDDPVYRGRFDRDGCDSGAVMVGAGTPPTSAAPRSAEWFSNWGSRVDVQGWGSEVTTTGYGDLFGGGGDSHQFYTAVFGGTSSASSIVAGAAALLVSIGRAAGESLTPVEVRDLLVETGTPQYPEGKHIGPLPNLVYAIGVMMPVCGDGIVNEEEACDDGNNAGGDGCSADCLSDESCGNGIVDAAAGEVCDDGNTSGGDGCSGDCLSNESCGNGVLDAHVGEVCDDGNAVGGDGCSGDCLSDESCGNGRLDDRVGEVCDDGNRAGGDGCSADCRSMEICGNGITDEAVGEECDDGNLAGGDGCSSRCTIESALEVKGGCGCCLVR